MSDDDRGFSFRVTLEICLDGESFAEFSAEGDDVLPSPQWLKQFIVMGGTEVRDRLEAAAVAAFPQEDGGNG